MCMERRLAVRTRLKHSLHHLEHSLERRCCTQTSYSRLCFESARGSTFVHSVYLFRGPVQPSPCVSCRNSNRPYSPHTSRLHRSRSRARKSRGSTRSALSGSHSRSAGAAGRVSSEQSDPASPEYHHDLTPQQFGRQFGPSDAGLQSVTQWLLSQPQAC